MTPTELHEEMIKAAMEAYKRTAGLPSAFGPSFEVHLRDRLSQVAQAVALEMVPVAVSEAREAEAFARGVEASRSRWSWDPR